MKALILAAGRGTRVQPLTDTVPKPMIPIVQKPVMEILIDQLRSHRFDEIVVNTSHLAPEIENYFRDGARFGVQIAYSFEGIRSKGRITSQPLGSAGAIRKIQSHSGFFDSTFAVVCGDAVVDADLSALHEFHRSKKSIATVALKSLPEEQLQNYGVAVRESDDRIVAFQEKPKSGEAKSPLASTGIYLFEPEILSWIPPEGAYDIGSQLFPRLAAAGEQIYGVELPFFQWFDIGRLEDYHATVMKAMVGYVRSFKMPGREVKEGVWVGPNVRADFDRLKLAGPVYIGGSAEIGDDCTLVGPVVVGAGAVVGSGTHLERSIVLDQTRVSPLSYLNNKVLGGQFCIDADGTVLDGRHTDTSWLFADARSLNAALTDDQRLVHANVIEAAKAA
jgi:mannose-1-phosphate guanylyltransferase